MKGRTGQSMDTTLGWYLLIPCVFPASVYKDVTAEIQSCFKSISKIMGCAADLKVAGRISLYLPQLQFLTTKIIFMISRVFVTVCKADYSSSLFVMLPFYNSHFLLHSKAPQPHMTCHCTLRRLEVLILLGSNVCKYADGFVAATNIADGGHTVLKSIQQPLQIGKWAGDLQPATGIQPLAEFLPYDLRLAAQDLHASQYHNIHLGYLFCLVALVSGHD